MGERDIHGGLVRLHILHHASREPIFGLGIIEELARHGYGLGAGTLYPMLHGLEKAGYLQSRTEQVAGKRRRVYSATRKGHAALRESKAKVWELFRELFEEELQFHGRAPHASRNRAATAASHSESGLKRRRRK
jgi:PadR family transcriptional regulator